MPGRGSIERAKKGERRLGEKYDLATAKGIGDALKEVYPPDEAADAQFQRLLGQLRDEPPTNFQQSQGGQSDGSD